MGHDNSSRQIEPPASFDAGVPCVNKLQLGLAADEVEGGAVRTCKFEVEGAGAGTRHGSRQLLIVRRADERQGSIAYGVGPLKCARRARLVGGGPGKCSVCLERQLNASSIRKHGNPVTNMVGL